MFKRSSVSPHLQLRQEYHMVVSWLEMYIIRAEIWSRVKIMKTLSSFVLPCNRLFKSWATEVLFQKTFPVRFPLMSAPIYLVQKWNFGFRCLYNFFPTQNDCWGKLNLVTRLSILLKRIFLWGSKVELGEIVLGTKICIFYLRAPAWSTRKLLSHFLTSRKSKHMGSLERQLTIWVDFLKHE